MGGWGGVTRLTGVTRGEGTEGGEEGKEEGGERGEEGGEEILAEGRTHQSKVVQEVLADLKKLLQNTKHTTADYSLTTI